MEKSTSISLVGVGGQGILLASEILARTAMLAGHDVKKSEVHGMSQRGGSVISQVRFGENVASPIISDGCSDILVAFEKLEALRWRCLLKSGGPAIVNQLDIIPVTVSSGLQPAVEDPDQQLAALFPDLQLVDAQAMAEEAGNQRTANIVLTGALARLMQFEVALWKQALEERLPTRLLEVNLRAFDAGYQSADAKG